MRQHVWLVCAALVARRWLGRGTGQRSARGEVGARLGRAFWRSRSDRAQRDSYGFLFICALLSVGSVACGVPDTLYFGVVAAPVAPDHLRYCNGGEPESLDPVMVSTSPAVKLAYALFDGLVNYDYESLPTPGLATHWEVDDELRTYTFHMRDATWTNGTPIVSYDVAYSLMRVLSQSTASSNADNVTPIKNALGYFNEQVATLREPVGELSAGAHVEIVAVGDTPWAPGLAPDLNARRALAPLRLRALGASVESAHAVVRQGAKVQLWAYTNQLATPPSPDGAPWAYVYAAQGEGVMGWVPAVELGEVEDAARVELSVRQLLHKDIPGDTTDAQTRNRELATREPRRVFKVPARALWRSFDAVGIRTPDARTVIFETADPTPDFLTIAANRALRPTPSATVSRNPRHWAEPGHIVSSGPLQLTAWVKRDKLEMVASSRYWNVAATLLKKLTVYAIDDQAAAANYYYAGYCDANAANNVPSTYLPVLAGDTRGGQPYRDFYVRPWLGTYFVWINSQKLANRHLRRALALAVNRAPIGKFTHAQTQPSAQLSPGTAIARLSPADQALCEVTATSPGVALIVETGKLCYVPPLGLDFDLAQARQELALAKAEMGAQFPTRLSYRYNAGSEEHKQIAEYLQQSWAAIGVTVELASQEWNSFVADTRKGDFELARFGNIASSPSMENQMLPLLTCDSPDNRGRYCNPAFDAALAAVKPMRDLAARLKAVAAAEKIAIEDAPLIPLYVYTQKHLIKPYVRNLAINAVDYPAFHRVWLDPSWRSGQPVPAPPGFSHPEVMPAQGRSALTPSAAP